jgi:phenylacetate-CoA ligase
MKGISSADLYDLFEKSQWWDEGELLTYQRGMLQALVNHAKDRAPFYSFRLQSLLSRNGKIDWSVWQTLPIITRKDVSTHADKLKALKVPAEHAPVTMATTSGSTGEPISVLTTNFMRSIISATGWRAQKWYGVDWGERLITRAYVPSTTLKTGDIIGSWGPPSVKVSRKGKNIYAYGIDHEQLFDFILATKPAYISVYGGSIEILCDISEEKQKNYRIKGIFSRGSMISTELRERARSVFGADVIEGFASQECGSIAHSCPTGAGLHINSETVFLEIVKDDGAYALPGEDGRVVVTPIASTAMPFIRYDLGDRAIAGERCGCGRSLPILKSISGRVMHSFRHPDGRVHIGGRVGPLRPMLRASRWQVAQIGATQYEIRYVSDHVIDDETKRVFTEQFKQQIFSDSVVIFKKLDEISTPKSGKFIEYINEFSSNDAV